MAHGYNAIPNPNITIAATLESFRGQITNIDVFATLHAELRRFF